MSLLFLSHLWSLSHFPVFAYFPVRVMSAGNVIMSGITWRSIFSPQFPITWLLTRECLTIWFWASVPKDVGPLDYSLLHWIVSAHRINCHASLKVIDTAQDQIDLSICCEVSIPERRCHIYFAKSYFFPHTQLKGKFITMKNLINNRYSLACKYYVLLKLFPRKQYWHMCQYCQMACIYFFFFLYSNWSFYIKGILATIILYHENVFELHFVNMFRVPNVHSHKNCQNRSL